MKNVQFYKINRQFSFLLSKSKIVHLHPLCPRELATFLKYHIHIACFREYGPLTAVSGIFARVYYH